MENTDRMEEEAERLRNRVAELGETLGTCTRLEEELRDYKDLYDNAPDMFVSVDAKTSKIVRCNQTVANALGYTKEELIGKPISFVYHPDCKDVRKKAFRSFVETGEVKNAELQAKCKDGSKIDVNLNVISVRDEQGKVLYSRSVWRDITERKQMQEELRRAHDVLEVRVQERTLELAEANTELISEVSERKRAEEAQKESEEKFRLLAENAYDGIVIATADGRYVYANRRAAEITACTVEELVTTSIDNFIFPEDLPGIMEGFNKRVSGENPSLKYEIFIKRMDGLKRLVEVTSSKTVWEGEPATVSIIRDITERKQAEQELRESEELFQQLSNAAFEGIVIHKEGKIEAINMAFAHMFGYDPAEAAGMDAMAVVSPGCRDIVQDKISSGYQKPYEAELLRKDGSTFTAEIHGRTIRHMGRSARVTAVRDITERKRSEEVIRESEERHRSLVEATTSIIWTTDESGGFTTPQHSWEKFTGQPWSEHKGFGWTKMIHPDDIDHVLIGWKWAIKELSLYETWGRVWNAALKEYRNFEVSVVPIKRPDGSLREWVGVIEDITERKRAEEALRESEERYKSIFDYNVAGIATADANNKLVKVNAAYCKMLGYSEEEALRLGVADVTHPDDRSVSAEVIGRLMRREVEDAAFEKRYVKKDRSIIFAKVLVSALYDEEGRYSLGIATIEDITERKLAEEALRESEEKYHALFEGSKDTIFMTTPEGRFLACNPACVDLFGFSSKTEVMKAKVGDLYNNPKDREMLKTELERKGFVKDFEIVFNRKDGQTGIGLITASVMRDKNDDITAYNGIMRDITEQKSLQAQLIQAQKMEAVGTLAGGIAHDFNNIMTVVKTMTSRALSKSADNLELKECLEPIRNASERAINLIQQLLTFSRTKPVELKTVNLNGTIDELLHMLRTLLSEDISIEKDLKHGLWNIEGDKGRIEQVVTNLVVNSSNAMPKGGKITLRIENIMLTEEQSKAAHGAATGNFVCLTVEDTGTGMDNETIEHIFEPFFTTRSPGGTGLGLSVAYGIVKEMNGWIDVSSEPGKGSKFVLYLPASMESKELVAKESIARKSFDGGGKRILLVEDEELVRMSTAMVLSDYGYIILEASSAEKAISLFNKEKGHFDLVLSDVVMPGRSGLQMVRPLLDINPNIPILFFSGHIDDKAQLDQITKDGFAFIQKPYDIPHLLQTIEESINGVS